MHHNTGSENLLLVLDQRRCISRDLGGYHLPLSMRFGCELRDARHAVKAVQGKLVSAMCAACLAA